MSINKCYKHHSKKQCLRKEGFTKKDCKNGRSLLQKPETRYKASDEAKHQQSAYLPRPHREDIWWTRRSAWARWVDWIWRQRALSSEPKQSVGFPSVGPDQGHVTFNITKIYKNQRPWCLEELLHLELVDMKSPYSCHEKPKSSNLQMWLLHHWNASSSERIFKICTRYDTVHEVGYMSRFEESWKHRRNIHLAIDWTLVEVMTDDRRRKRKIWGFEDPSNQFSMKVRGVSVGMLLRLKWILQCHDSKNARLVPKSGKISRLQGAELCHHVYTT